jgi:hypothetical protein
MARSILGLVGLGGTLVFALPVALLGVEFLVRGRTTAGAGLVGIAVLMVAIEEYVTTPADVPGVVAEKTVGKIVGSEEDESAEDG